jgi:hypothetical protein
VVNKYSLGRYLTGFLVLNKDLLLRSRRLTTIGLEVANVGIRQAGESSALVLRTYSRYTSDVINPLAF